MEDERGGRRAGSGGSGHARGASIKRSCAFLTNDAVAASAGVGECGRAASVSAEGAQLVRDVWLPKTFLLRFDESSQGRGRMRVLLVLRRIPGALAANGIQRLELERFKLLDDFLNFMRAVTGLLLCAVAYGTDETGGDPSVFWKLQFMRIAVLGCACNGCGMSAWAAAGKSNGKRLLKITQRKATSVKRAQVLPKPPHKMRHGGRSSRLHERGGTRA